MLKNIDENSTVDIYALIDPRNNTIRYIGCSLNAVKRYERHLTKSQLSKDSHKDRWIKKLMELNLLPDLAIIESVSSNTYQEREKYWIALYGRDNLTNGTDGGDGCVNRSEYTREKLRTSHIGQKAWNKGIPNSPEKNKNMSNLIRGRKNNDSSSSFIGVYYSNKKWYAKIHYNGKNIHIGTFLDEITAAIAYNMFAIDIFGWKAKINIIHQEEFNNVLINS